uniref:Uncharacterized protein n=1 Tax=Aegilops tauschii subsp. strangulata TaxID=200361 RepID=A0A453Q6G3_AEGTS
RAHAVPRVGSRVLHIPVLFMLQLWGSFHVHTTYWTLHRTLLASCCWKKTTQPNRFFISETRFLLHKPSETG